MAQDVGRPVAMISGSNRWINTDRPDPLTDYWPSASSPLYASKNSPFALFTDIQGVIV